MISLSRSVVTVTCVCSYTVVCLPVVLSVKLWASAFGGEIKSISAKYSGSPLLQKVFFFVFLFFFSGLFCAAPLCLLAVYFHTHVVR